MLKSFRGRQPQEGNLLKWIDTFGVTFTIWMVIKAWFIQDDPAWFAAIVAALCFWLAVRTVVLCSCGGNWWPAPGFIFLLLAMLTNHIGAFVHLQRGWGPPVEPEAAWNMIWSFSLAYVCFALATWVYYKLSGLDTKAMVNEFLARPVSVPRTQESLLIPALIIFMIGLAASMYLLGGKLQIVDVARTLSSGAESQAKLIAYTARQEMSGNVGYKGHGYLDQMRIAIMPMIALTWLIMAKVTRRRLYSWLAFLAISATAITMVAGLQRAPVVLFIVQAVVVLMVTFKTKPNIRWAYGVGLTLILFFGLTILLGRGGTADTFSEKMGMKWESVVNRVYLSNSLSSVKTFELFPKYEEFRYGGTWATDIANLAPGRGTGLSAEIYEYLWNEPGSGGVHFIAEMWANGGYGMVAFVSFVTGLFMFWLNTRMLVLREKTPLRLTYMGLMMFCFGLVGYGGFMTPINRGVIAFAILYLILNNMGRIGDRMRNKEATESNHQQNVSGANSG